MNFFQTLSAAIVEQSMAKKTRDCYYHHARQFHQFIQKPAVLRRDLGQLDLPPPRRVIPFQPEMRRMA